MMGKQWCLSRLIGMREMGEAVPGLVRAGRPRSRVGLLPSLLLLKGGIASCHGDVRKR